MSKLDPELDRLLRAAAGPREIVAEEPPFGFETRVVAQWHAQRSVQECDASGFATLVRKVAIGAVIVAAAASGDAVWQLKQNEELDEPTTNAYALADSMIAPGTWQ